MPRRWLRSCRLLAARLRSNRCFRCCSLCRRCRLLQRIQSLLNLLGPRSKCLFSRLQIALCFERLSIGGWSLRLSCLLAGFRGRCLQLLFSRRGFLTGCLLNALCRLLQRLGHCRVVQPPFMPRGSGHIRSRRLHIFRQFLLPLFGCRQLILCRGQLTAEIRRQTFRRLLQLLQRLRRFCRILFGQLGGRVVRGQSRHGGIIHGIAILLRRLHSLSCTVLLPTRIIQTILHGLSLLLLSRQLLLQPRIRRLFVQLLLSLLNSLVSIPHLIFNILHVLLSTFHGVFRLPDSLIGRPFLLFTERLPLFFGILLLSFTSGSVRENRLLLRRGRLSSSFIQNRRSLLNRLLCIRCCLLQLGQQLLLTRTRCFRCRRIQLLLSFRKFGLSFRCLALSSSLGSLSNQCSGQLRGLRADLPQVLRQLALPVLKIGI